MITVAKDGSSDYTSVQEAIDSITSVPETVFIKNGIYKERVEIHKDNITLIGENADGTVITNKYKKFMVDRTVIKKIKEKIFDNKYIEYSDFEKLGAACIIGDKNEIVSYLSKIIKVTPVDKYVVKGWPVLEPYLTDSKVQRILESSVKRCGANHDVGKTV